MKTNRIFRVFVSSTFVDMKIERDALQREVFPKLQQLCKSHGCRFQAIDLRWGVSEEAALDQQTMNICLKELKRCQDISPRPNFLILLGDRYGWMPLPSQIDKIEFESLLALVSKYDRKSLEDWYRLDTNAIPPEYLLRPRIQDIKDEADYDAWMSTELKLHSILVEAINRMNWGINDQRRVKYETSATHQEIIHGVLENIQHGSNHAFAFFRNIMNREKLPQNNIYVDTDSSQIDKLKDFIKESDISVSEYDAIWNGQTLDYSITNFCADVYKSLRRVIEDEIKQIDNIPEVIHEINEHSEFADACCKNFSGRQEVLSLITQYIKGKYNTSPLVIYGPSGCGKSALMAKAAQVTSHISNTYILKRFIGATPSSTNVITLLRSLCKEIYDNFGFENLKVQELESADENAKEMIQQKYEIQGDYPLLRDQFHTFLGLIPPNQNMILFLDALDQLSESNNAHNLEWLPTKVLPHVHIIISTLESNDSSGQCLRASNILFPEENLIRINSMSLIDGEKALDAFLRDAKRDLTYEQRTMVLNKFSGCPLPLYIKLAFEEARHWSSFTGTPDLANDIHGIISDLFARLESPCQHGKIVVSECMGLLTAAHHGLSETEMIELLSRKPSAVMDDLHKRSTKSPYTDTVPPILWLRVYHDLAPYLQERATDNSTLISFYHRQFVDVASERYLLQEHHSKLAAFFEEQPSWLGNALPNHRKCAELPFQLVRCNKDRLYVTLTNYTFLNAKCAASMIYDLLIDYDNAVELIDHSLYEKSQLNILHLIKHAILLSINILSNDFDQFATQVLGRLGNINENIKALKKQWEKQINEPWLRSRLTSLIQASENILSVCYPENAGWPCRLVISPDEKTVAIVEKDGLTFWDSTSGIRMDPIDGGSKFSKINWETERDLVPDVLPIGNIDKIFNPILDYSYVDKNGSQRLECKVEYRPSSFYAYRYNRTSWRSSVTYSNSEGCFTLYDEGQSYGNLTTGRISDAGDVVVCGGLNGVICVWKLNDMAHYQKGSFRVGDISAIAIYPKYDKIVLRTYDGYMYVVAIKQMNTESSYVPSVKRVWLPDGSDYYIAELMDGRGIAGYSSRTGDTLFTCGVYGDPVNVYITADFRYAILHGGPMDRYDGFTLAVYDIAMRREIFSAESESFISGKDADPWGWGQLSYVVVAGNPYLITGNKNKKTYNLLDGKLSNIQFDNSAQKIPFITNQHKSNNDFTCCIDQSKKHVSVLNDKHEEICRFRPDKPVYDAAISSDGCTISVVAGCEGIVHILDLITPAIVTK